MRLTAPAWQPLRRRHGSGRCADCAQCLDYKTLPIGRVFFVADGADVVVMRLQVGNDWPAFPFALSSLPEDHAIEHRSEGSCPKVPTAQCVLLGAMT